MDRSPQPDFERLARRIPGVDGSSARLLAQAFATLRRSARTAIARGSPARGVDRQALEALLQEHPCGEREAAEVEELIASTLKELGLEGAPRAVGFLVLEGGRPGKQEVEGTRPGSGAATLEAHGATRGGDNYVQATFNFWYGTRDDRKRTLNRWDVKLVEKRGVAMLEMARHRKTPSVMADLGELPWEEVTSVFSIDGLMGEATAGRWKAVVGHTYVLHVDDRQHDYWAALRVTAIDPKAHTVTFDWRRLSG